MFVDSADRTPHYSLRKLSVGVASVLLSTTLWMGANGSVAHADTINGATVAVNASSSAENKSDSSKTQMASKDQEQTQTAESTSQDAAASAEKQNGETQNGQVQEGSRANAGVQTATANDAHAQAGMTKQEPAAPSQQTASQAKVSAPASAEEQASTAEQAAAAATEGKTNGSANADTDATTKAKKDLAKSSDAATENAKNESTTTLGVSQAFKPSTVAALNKKMVMASLAGTASAGSESKSDDLKSYETTITSLINRAHQDGLTVTKEDAKTYATKQEVSADLDKQVADIQGKVTKYEADKAAYDAAMGVYYQDMGKWETAQNDPHMVKGISQGLSFANEHDASLEVTSGSDKRVNFIKSSAWLGSDGEGVYTDGITNGGNISKSFSDSDISYDQDEGTGKDIKDSKGWGKTYTGVRLKKGDSVVARYTGLKNSVYIDKDNVLHKLSEAQVKYTLNETTADDGTANIFLSNSPNIALWYGAAGSQINGRNGRVDLTVDLTFYDENGNPITMGKESNAWLDMSSLNNGQTKIEYFAPNGNTTEQIPGSSINGKHADGWYADKNNEIKPAPAGWDNPTSADRYYGAAIMELEGNSFHIGQKIIKYNPSLTLSRNVYSWFALDSLLATAYKPVEPKAPEKPLDIAWHEVTYEPQKATVTYYDDTDNKTTLKSDSLEGDSNADSGYTTKSSIDDYKSKGYEFVSDDTKGQNVVFDNDSSVIQNYEVHLKHGTEPKQDETTVKETIHYNYADGSKAAEDHSDSVTLSRTGTKDKVTGNTVWNAWSAGKISSVTSPTIPGYTADKKEIGAKFVNGPHDEFVETVTYKADTQKATVTYIDDTDNKTTLKSDSLEGDSNADSGYTTKSSIDDYKSKGYELVKDDTNGADVVFDHDSTKDQSYEVHLKHGTESNHDKTTVKETIHYNYADGSKAAEDHSDSVTLSRTGTKDKVTGNTVWNAWSTGKISSVTSPTIPGYTADKKEISAKFVNGPHDEFVETVTYKVDTQKATVTYVDDTDNKTTLKSDSLEGDSNADSKYNTKSSIEDYENKGYELVSDDTNGADVVFDNDSSVNQNYEVHLKHGTVTVTPDDKNPVKPGDKINPNDPNSPKYQDDVKHDNLAKDAKQTVHYEGAGIDTPADSVTTRKDAFTRTVTYDKVTGKSTTSGWNKPKTTFDKVDTPVVKGYTADKKQAGGLTATPDHPEVKDTVVYTPNGSIVPVDPNGHRIPGTNPVPYENDPTDPTKVVGGKVPEVPSWTPKKGQPGDPVVPTDPTKDTKVPYDHTMTPGETTVSGKQTVTYVYKDKGGKVVKTKKVEEGTTFTGKTNKDEVTGETTTVWDQKDHKYTEVTTPVEPGYTADKQSVGGETVTPDDPNRSYTVTYTQIKSDKPTTPETKPTKPLVRKTKSDPAHPNAGQLNGHAKTPSEPVTPGTPTLNGAGLTNADGNGIGSANSVKTAAGDAKLPQTGAKESPAAVAAGLIALGMSASIGLASLRKKRH